MRIPALRGLVSALRLVLVALVSASALAVLSSSSCAYRVDDDDELCDDDDFDDDDFTDDDDELCGDDDDGVIVVLGTSQDSYRLDRARFVPADDPAAHPVAAVRDVEGIGIFELFGPGAHGAEDFRRLADRVLLVNEDVLGLPPEAGRRRFAGVRFGAETVVVSYVQERPTASSAGATWRGVPGAATLLVFDSAGRLSAIENRLRAAPDPLRRSPSPR